jgi:dolichyl-phosphate-mannose-protein mannosyltransferase
VIVNLDADIGRPAPRLGAANLVALTLVLLLALALRAPGLTFGLPGYPHDDEHTVLGMVADVAGALNPHDFRWPATLQVIITAVAVVAYLFVGVLTGKYASLAEMRAAFWAESDSMVVVCRIVVLCAALLTLAALYFVFRRRSRSLGLAAVAILAVLPLHVRNSTYALPDIPATFFFTAGVALSVFSLDRPSKQSFFFSGAIAGLGAAVKYYDVTACAAILAAALLATQQPLDRLRLVAAGALGAMAGFLIGCPYLLVVPREFVSSLAEEFAHQQSGHLGNEPDGSRLVWYVKEILAPAMTTPVLLVGAVGAVLAVWRRDRWLWPAIAAIVAYSVLAISSRTSFDRYAIPVLPFFAAISAYAVFTIASMASRQPGVRALLSATLLVALIALPLARSIGITRELLGVESRIQASAWMRSHVSPAAFWVRTPYAPHLESAETFRFSQQVPQKLRTRLMEGDFEWAAVDSWTTERIATPAARRNHPEVVATQEALLLEIRRRGQLVATFEGWRKAQSPTVWIYHFEPGIRESDSRDRASLVRAVGR